jgi:phosphomannomutase/phosphoglucomutase
MLSFGTNGIRGLLDRLTPEFASRMAASFGTWIKNNNASGNPARSGTEAGCNILLARDTRTSGKMLEGAVMAGLLSSGCSVTKLGICPSPTVEFSVLHQKAAGAITITASHNPPEWNALKFVDAQSIAISRERGAEIEKIFESNSMKRAAWDELKPVVKYDAACSDHMAAILGYIDASAFKKKKPRLVLDCANGTTGRIAPALFKSLGCSVTTLNAQEDGHFPGRQSEPTEANIQDLIASVKELKADMGIAWDGDGDRVVFVDERGKFVIGDKIFALCEKMALAKAKKGSAIVTTVSTSNAIRDLAEARGCKVSYCKVGAPYISEEMKKLNAVMGGEEVGGVIWPSISYGKDGLMTAAKIAEAACSRQLSELVAAIPAYFNSKTKVPCAPAQKKPAMEKIAKAMGHKGTLTTIDGIRVDFNRDSWAIVRASGTENYLRIFAEAKTPEKAQELMQQYEKIAKAAASG